MKSQLQSFSLNFETIIIDKIQLSIYIAINVVFVRTKILCAPFHPRHSILRNPSPSPLLKKIITYSLIVLSQVINCF